MSLIEFETLPLFPANTETTDAGGDKSRDIRFDRIRYRVQPVLYLARLLPDRIQRAWITRGVRPPWSAEGVLVSEIVARSPAYLRHGGGEETKINDRVTGGVRRRRETKRRTSGRAVNTGREGGVCLKSLASYR